MQDMNQAIAVLDAKPDNNLLQQSGASAELTPKEQAAMESIPDDAEHWMRGDKMDFGLREWRAASWDSPRPEEYEFESASGFGGVNNVEMYRCQITTKVTGPPPVTSNLN